MFVNDEMWRNKKWYKSPENNRQLHAYNVIGFDTWIIINNLPCNFSVVESIKNGRSIFSLIVLKGLISNTNNQKRHPPLYNL